MSSLLKIITVSLLLAVPASALQMHEMHLRGQVPIITTAEIDGQRVGLALAIDRGINELPESALVVFPNQDPSSWRTIDLPNGPGAMATGDVTGDGNDEVAITYHFEGATCPSEALGQWPCGVVRILDGHALLQGEAREVGLVRILPPTGSCSPTNHAPSSLSLADVTGDGLADLAFGQLGMMPGSCGVVHVVSGDRLQGETDMAAACARVEGPVLAEGGRPTQFGATTRLYTLDEGRGVLAVGAPHADAPSESAAGHVLLHDLTGTCPRQGLTPTEPPLVAEAYGTTRSHQLGVAMAHVGGLLWVSGTGGVLALDPASLEKVRGYETALPIPLSDAGDVTGDGESELLVGSWVMTTDGQVVMALNPFAEQNFRGAVLSDDHIISSDNFGARLWSLTDLWTPYVSVAAEKDQVVVGQTVRVNITKTIALMPVHDPPSWSVSGGTVVDNGADWIDVRADAPGNIVAQLTLGGGTALVRVPVVADEATANVTGPAVVQARQPFTLRVSAPQDAAVSWRAPGASPAEDSGRIIKTRYDSAGAYTVAIDVTFADGRTITLTHGVEVTDNDVRIVAPTSIQQGKDLELAVSNPDRDLRYVWYLEGTRMGPLSAAGPSASVPAAGWGPVEVSVVARSSDGKVAGVGQTVVEVENLPPRIQSITVSNAYDVDGLEADLVVSDPGGDPVTITWYADGAVVGEGRHLSVPDLEPGQVVLTAVVQDEGGLGTNITRAVQVAESRWQTIEERNGSVDGGPGADGNLSGTTDHDDRFLPGPGALLTVGLLVSVAAGARRRNR